MKNLAADQGNRQLVSTLGQRMLAAMRETEDPAIGLVEQTLKTPVTLSQA